VFPKGGIAGIEDRYSIAYFGNPVADTVLEPVPSAMVRALEKEDFVKAMTAAEHLTSRINATYL
jgi:isopenicillin N synthase-like dioxygenase